MPSGDQWGRPGPSSGAAVHSGAAKTLGMFRPPESLNSSRIERMTAPMDYSGNEEAIDRVIRSIRTLFNDSGDENMSRDLAAFTGFWPTVPLGAGGCPRDKKWSCLRLRRCRTPWTAAFRCESDGRTKDPFRSRPAGVAEHTAALSATKTLGLQLKPLKGRSAARRWAGLAGRGGAGRGGAGRRVGPSERGGTVVGQRPLLAAKLWAYFHLQSR